MDLKRLRYFVAVARLRSFTRAAEALHIAQPPLSQRIQELEDQLGVRLIERGSRPIQLTAAGQSLLEQAIPLLQRTEAMVASMRRFNAPGTPTFTLGAVGASFPGSLAEVIRRLRQARPGLHVDLHELNGPQQLDALREGRIDAGISRVALQAEGIRSVVLREEALELALPADHPLAATPAPVSVRELSGLRMLMYVCAPRPSLGDHIQARLRGHGVVLHDVQEIDRYDSALLMVAAGCGATIVPAAARGMGIAGIVHRPLLEPLTAPVVLCHREGDTSIALQSLYAAIGDHLSLAGHPVPPALQAR